MPIGALDKNRRAGHLHVKTGIDREKRAFSSGNQFIQSIENISGYTNEKVRNMVIDELLASGDSLRAGSRRMHKNGQRL